MLTWSEVEWAVGYRVYTATDPWAAPEEWQLLAEQPGTGYSLPLSPDQTRFFRVTTLTP